MSHQAALSTEESEANSSSWVTGLEPHRCPVAHASFDGQRRWSQGFNKDNAGGSHSLSFEVWDPQFRSELDYPEVDPIFFNLDELSEFSQNHIEVESMSFTLEEYHPSISERASSLVHRASPASKISSLNASSSIDPPLDMGTIGCINHSRSASRKHYIADTTSSLECSDNNISNTNVTCIRFPDQSVSYVDGDKHSNLINVICTPQKSEESCPSMEITEDKTSRTPYNELLSISGKATQPVSNLIQELYEYPIGCATPTAPRTTTYHQNRFTSLSRTYGDGSKLWAKDIMLTGFTGNSKKARSQISYSISPRGDELRLKHKEHFHMTQSHSSAKTADAKRLPDSTNRSRQNNPEPLTCIANVLVTVGDRGWRQYDTQITTDIDGQSDRRICVRLTEGTKYSHKVCRVLRPGATNRYTHAMMWKGGPEWYLEFPDRRQWFIFKQMHDECYSHNIRAVYVKNIPIPGVCLVEGRDDNDGVPFVRQQDYICHVGPDVEMALDESRLMYDMDNDDEDWILRWNKSLGGKDDNTACELTDDMFERVMDRFEKFTYTHNCNELTIDQLSELDMDNIPLDIIKVVHDYWHDKRQTKGMPLVRHFQVPSKGRLKLQRSHKKLTYSRCHSFSRKRNGFRQQVEVSGRKHNEYAGDGRMCESYDGGSSLHPPTGFSTRTDDSPRVDASERSSAPRYFFRTNSVRRNASSAFSEDQQLSPSSFRRHRKINRGGAPDQPPRPFSEDVKLRDAASAAQHAAMVARLKREKAHCLARQADLALHKATVALMVADAIKASSSRDPSRVVGNTREGSS